VHRGDLLQGARLRDLRPRWLAMQAVQVSEQLDQRPGRGSGLAGIDRAPIGGGPWLGLVRLQSRPGVAPHEQRDEGSDPGADEAISDLLDLGVHNCGTDALVVRVVEGSHHCAQVTGQLGVLGPGGGWLPGRPSSVATWRRGHASRLARPVAMA